MPDSSPSSDRTPASETACTCGQAGTFWGGCESCGLDRWVVHRCPFPCDDVTCENVAMCLPCLGAPPCPAHDDEDYALMLATAHSAPEVAS